MTTNPLGDLGYTGTRRTVEYFTKYVLRTLNMYVGPKPSPGICARTDPASTNVRVRRNMNDTETVAGEGANGGKEA